VVQVYETTLDATVSEWLTCVRGVGLWDHTRRRCKLVSCAVSQGFEGGSETPAAVAVEVHQSSGQRRVYVTRISWYWTHLPSSLWWTSYVVPKPPKGWLKNAKCPEFET